MITTILDMPVLKMCSCVKLLQYITYLIFVGCSYGCETLRLDNLEVVITEEPIVEGLVPYDQLLPFYSMKSTFNGLATLGDSLKNDKMPVVFESFKDSGNGIMPILIIQVAKYPTSHNAVVITRRPDEVLDLENVLNDIALVLERHLLALFKHLNPVELPPQCRIVPSIAGHQLQHAIFSARLAI